MLSKHKELLTIKEFSALTGIEESTLRYWDRIGLFRPAMRHEDNNYRLYTLEQAVTVDFVTVLSSLRLPLKTICDAREDRNPKKILSLLQQQKFEIDRELIRLQGSYSTIHTLEGIIHRGMEATPGEIGVQHLDEMPIIMGPENAYGEGEPFCRVLKDYCRQARYDRVNIHNPIGGYHTSMELFIEAPALPQRFFSIDSTGRDHRPAGKYLVGYAQGYYGQMGGMPQKMAAWARENDLECEGPVYVVYLLDNISVPDPAQYLAQISVRVRKTNKSAWKTVNG
ncbi:MAG: MerR family DNA-binding transcriptional regulator [Firmicutes bacterium]|nr:MerR family DNA-binding transcriptional regulator [Bacillota bacterium]